MSGEQVARSQNSFPEDNYMFRNDQGSKNKFLAQDNRRFLPTTITNSRKCKTDCIDKGFTFCSSLDHRNGTCYGLGEVPIVRDVCSNSISSDSDLKYWSCNYNLNCTDNYKVKPKGFTTSNLVTLQPRNAWVFLENFCTYLL